MEPGKNKNEYPSTILLTTAQVSRDISPLHRLGILLMKAKSHSKNFHPFLSSQAFLIIITQPNSQTCKIRTDTILFFEVTPKVAPASQIRKTKST
jgi:hypothetical protein